MLRPSVTFSTMAVLLYFSTIGAGFAFTVPMLGENLNVQPKLETHSVITIPPTTVIPHAARQAQRLRLPSYTYTAITIHKARRQGKIVAGGTHWNCSGSRCIVATTWPRPTVQSCKSLAGVVGTVQSFGRPGSSLGTVKIKRCNTGIIVTKAKRKQGTILRPGIAAQSPALMPHTFVRPPVQGTFAARRAVAARSASNTVSTGQVPDAKASHRSKFGRGLSPTNKQSSMAKTMPLEYGVMKKLQKLEEQQEADLDRKTEQMAGISEGTSRHPHHGGFAPAQPSTANRTTSGGFAGGPLDNVGKYYADNPRVVQKRTKPYQAPNAEGYSHRPAIKSKYLVVPGGALIMNGIGTRHDSAPVQFTSVSESSVFHVTPGGSLSMIGLREDTFIIVPGGLLSMTGVGDGYRSSQVDEARITKPSQFLIVPGGKMTMTGLRITIFGEKIRKKEKFYGGKL